MLLVGSYLQKFHVHIKSPYEWPLSVEVFIAYFSSCNVFVTFEHQLNMNKIVQSPVERPVLSLEISISATFVAVPIYQDFFCLNLDKFEDVGLDSS